MKVFITGGTTGIGLALAKIYAKSGATVGACGRDLSKVSGNVLKEYSNIKFYTADVTDKETLQNAIKDFAQGELDLLIASAGRSVGSKTKLPSFDVAREVININVIGVLNTFEAGLEIMLPKKKGHIAALGSVAGLVGLPGAAVYSASKAAVLKLCESYAIDLKELGIDVTAIAPGFIDTPLTRKNDHTMPFLMNVDKAAELIKKNLDKKNNLFIFPLPMKIVMYILDRMPRWAYRKIMGIKLFNYSKE